MRRSTACGAVLLLVAAALGTAGGEAKSRWVGLGGVAGGRPAELAIDGKKLSYLCLAPGGVIQFAASGGDRIRIRVRREMKPGDVKDRLLEVFFAADQGAPVVRGKKVRIDPKASDPSRPDVALSKAYTTELTVPEGAHTYLLSLSARAKRGVCVLVQRAAPPKAAARPPKGPKKPRKAHAARKPVLWRLTVTPGLELTYDDNVFSYGDRAIRRFEDDRTRSEFDHVSSIDDLLTKPSLDVELAHEFVEGLRTSLDVKAKAYVYAENDRKDHGRFEGELKQLLGARDNVSVSYALTPDVYDRTRLRVVAERRRETSVYDKDEWGFRYFHRFSVAIAADAAYAYSWKDYNESFDERDEQKHTGGARVKATLYPWWWVRLGYEYTVAEARSQNEGAVATIPDTSYFAHVVTLENHFDLSKRFSLDLDWRHEIRSYTSDDPADAVHFRRDDRRDEFSAKLKYEPRKGMEVWVEGVRKVSANDIGLSSGDGDEVLGYEDDQVTVGVEIGF